MSLLMFNHSFLCESAVKRARDNQCMVLHCPKFRTPYTG